MIRISLNSWFYNQFHLKHNYDNFLHMSYDDLRWSILSVYHYDLQFINSIYYSIFHNLCTVIQNYRHYISDGLPIIYTPFQLKYHRDDNDIFTGYNVLLTSLIDNPQVLSTTFCFHHKLLFGSCVTCHISLIMIEYWLQIVKVSQN